MNQVNSVKVNSNGYSRIKYFNWIGFDWSLKWLIKLIQLRSIHVNSVKFKWIWLILEIINQIDSIKINSG